MMVGSALNSLDKYENAQYSNGSGLQSILQDLQFSSFSQNARVFIRNEFFGFFVKNDKRLQKKFIANAFLNTFKLIKNMLKDTMCTKYSYI